MITQTQYESAVKDEEIANSKLTEDQVLTIRSLADRCIFFNKQLAEMYNVSLNTIKRIINRETWKHI